VDAMMQSNWRTGEVLLFTDDRQKIESSACVLLIENFGTPESAPL